MDAPEGDKAEPLTETAEIGSSTAPAPEHSTRSSIAITVLAVGGSAVGNLLAYKIITMLGSPEVFTAYSTERRYLSFLLPLLMLGAGVSLPLRISIKPDEQENVRILYGQLAVSSLFAGLLLVMLIALPPCVLLALLRTRHEPSGRHSFSRPVRSMPPRCCMPSTGAIRTSAEGPS